MPKHTSQSKTIAVTGAEGFIGRRLVKALKSRKKRVVILKGDVRQPKTWNKRFGLLYHCAAAVPGSGSFRDADYYSVNVQGTLQALEACRKNKARMVLLSTAGVYFPKAKSRLKVGDPAGGSNAYNKSKYFAEQLCRFYAGCNAVNSGVLRVFNVYGPGQNEPFIIAHLFRCAKKGKKAKIKHRGSYRDYIYVTDVVEAMLKCGRLKESFGMYNVGCGKGHTVNEVVRLISRLNGQKVSLAKVKAGKDPLPYAVASVSMTQRKLRWKPKVTLPDGLQRILEGCDD